ncbi:MAG: NUDIX hydrolase [Polyangia bacterium]
MSAPRKAATVLCLRAAPTGGRVEVLLVRRSHRASFMANAYVFPGGRVDEADAAAGAERQSRAAAARELREEVGLACTDLDRFVPFAHWITPSLEPKRFDTDFFVLGLQGPAGGAAIDVTVDGTEVFDPLWLPPDEALARYLAGALNLPPPTACTLEDLAAELAPIEGTSGADPGSSARALAALLQRLPARRPLPLLPKLEMASAPDGASEISIVLPWDPDFGALPGEGTPQPAIALGGAEVKRRIRRCSLRLPGADASYAVRATGDTTTLRWLVERMDA